MASQPLLSPNFLLRSFMHWLYESEWEPAFDDFVGSYIASTEETLDLMAEEVIALLTPPLLDEVSVWALHEFLGTEYEGDGFPKDDFILESRDRLPAGSAELLTRIANSSPGLYRVEKVLPDSKFRLANLLVPSDSLTVSAPYASQFIAVDDAIGVHIVDFNGELTLSGAVYQYPEESLSMLIDGFADAMAGAMEDIPKKQHSDPLVISRMQQAVLSEAAPVFSLVWILASIKRIQQMPFLDHRVGTPNYLIRNTFSDVSDADLLTDAFAAQSDFDRLPFTTPQWAWFGNSDRLGVPIRAFIWLGPGGLQAEVNSDDVEQEVLTRLGEIFGSQLGTPVRYAWEFTEEDEDEEFEILDEDEEEVD